MKTAILLITSAALFTFGAGVQEARIDAKHSTPRVEGPNADAIIPTTTRPASDVGSMVNDVRVELALFGSGSHLADVTDRVVQLLRSEPNGFLARADFLHNYPAPGKNKLLLIRYPYHDQERLFLITGGNRASYTALVGGDDDKHWQPALDSRGDGAR